MEDNNWGKPMMKKLFAVAAMTLVALSTQAGTAQDARMGAGQQGSQNFGVNASLAQALTDRTSLDISVQSFGGPAAYLPLLQSGELDVAAAVMPDVGDAIRGRGPFDGQPMDQLVLLASMFPSPVGLMVADDSGIETIADLQGQRVAWGLPAQASLLPYVEGSLANGGLTLDDVELVPVTSVGAGVDELIAGRVDATLFALRAGKVVEADSALGGVRWLPYDASDEAVAAMQNVASEAYLVDVSADDGVIGIASDMPTMAYDYALVVGAHVPDDVVQAIVDALADDPAGISETSPVLGSLDPDNFIRVYPGLTYHPIAEATLSN